MEDVKKDMVIEMFMLDWIRRKHKLNKYKPDTYANHSIGSDGGGRLSAHLMINGRSHTSYTLEDILKDIQ